MHRSAVPAVDAPRREYVDESRWRMVRLLFASGILLG